MQQFLTDPMIWFVIGLVLILLEFLIPGVIIVFFGVGAWVTALLALIFDFNLATEIIFFLIISILNLTLFRARLMKKLSRKTEECGDNFSREEYIGQKAKVTNDIRPNSTGKVEFQGTNWEAESDIEIKKDQLVKIVDIKNITLIVKPID